MNKEKNLTGTATTEILALLENEDFNQETFNNHLKQIKQLCRDENTYEPLGLSAFFSLVTQKILELAETFSSSNFRSILVLAINCLAALPKTASRANLVAAFFPEVFMSLSFLDIPSDLFFHFLQNGQKETIDVIKEVPASRDVILWLLCLESHSHHSADVEREKMCHYFLCFLLKRLGSDLFVEWFFYGDETPNQKFVEKIITSKPELWKSRKSIILGHMIDVVVLRKEDSDQDSSLFRSEAADLCHNRLRSLLKATEVGEDFAVMQLSEEVSEFAGPAWNGQTAAICEEIVISLVDHPPLNAIPKISPVLRILAVSLKQYPHYRMDEKILNTLVELTTKISMQDPTLRESAIFTLGIAIKSNDHNFAFYERILENSKRF